MLYSSVVFHFAFFWFVNTNFGLEQLPQDIVATDTIRDVINQVFFSLQLKINKNLKIKGFTTIHQYFVTLTQTENDNWKKVSNFTRLSNIDNGTIDLTTIINDILNEENKIKQDNETLNDGDVNKYIKNFLSTLANLKEIYLVNNSYSSVNKEVLQHFDIVHTGHGNTTVDLELESTENGTDEKDFWEPLVTRRIFKGERTKIKHYPFVASVQIFNQFSCAGSIIHTDLVITAASCLQLAHNNRFYRENPAFLSVRVGSSFYNAGGENIPVLEVYFHPSYSPKTLHNNLALMRLVREIKFKKRQRNVKKIALDINGWALPMTTPGITIVGWGAKTTSNKVHNPWTNKISMAVLDIYSLEDCRDIYSKEYVTRKHFCAGFISKGGGACNRDVGAPGVVDRTLTGVVSFGSPNCGASDAPTVFTKLGFYVDWIEDIMEQEPPKSRPKTTTRGPHIAPTIMSSPVDDPLNFKLEPLDLKNVESINELEVGRTDDQVFKEFLETVFTDKELREFAQTIPATKLEKLQINRTDPKPKIKGKKPFVDITRIRHEVETSVESANDGSFEPVQFVTKMNNFDAKEKTSRETDLEFNKTFDGTEIESLLHNLSQNQNSEESGLSIENKEKVDQQPYVKENDSLNIEKGADVSLKPSTGQPQGSTKFKIEQLDDSEKENVEQLDVSQKHNIEQINDSEKREIDQQDKSEKMNVFPTKDSTRSVLDKELDEQIDELIKNLDDTSAEVIESLQDRKVIDDTKLLDLLEKTEVKNRDGKKKLDSTDDNILTLLYLSESERKENSKMKRNNRGLNDNKNFSNNLTYEPFEIMSKSEMYDILADAIRLEEN